MPFNWNSHRSIKDAIKSANKDCVSEDMVISQETQREVLINQYNNILKRKTSNHRIEDVQENQKKKSSKIKPLVTSEVKQMAKDYENKRNQCHIFSIADKEGENINRTHHY